MNQKSRYTISSFWIYTIFVTLIIDQLSKVLIKAYMPVGSSIDIISDFLHFSYRINPGIAFSWDPFGNSFILLLVSAIAIVLIFKILYDSSEDSLLTQFSLSLIVGGALGNFIDRFFSAFKIMDYRGVIDFIDIGINNYRFYIFNFADSFITVGIILYVISFIRIRLFNDREQKR